MARPILPTPTLRGKDAIRFLKEKERVENLDPNCEEAKRRNAFLDHCVEVYKKTKPVNL